MKRVLLDTNGYSHLQRGDRLIRNAVNQAEEVFLSVITLGELYAGFRSGSRRDENLKRLDRFLGKPRVRLMVAGALTASVYGNVRYNLRQRGTPIPENDIWIAAQAIEVKAELITYDEHFLAVPRLKLWKELKN